jgi:phosphoglycolate phosphatase-like HAD superfamily hydrolase
MPKKLLLFDIDGTLVLSKGAGREATARSLQEVFGTDAGVRSLPFGGKTDWQVLGEILPAYGFNDADIRARLDDFQQAMARHLQAIIGTYAVEACIGTHDVIAALGERTDILPGIVTGNVQTTAPIKLRAAGFDPSWFVIGAYGSESARRNDLPPLALQRAIAYSGHAIAPENVIVIGDTVADIECTRAIPGAIAVAVCTGFEARENLIAAQPDYLLENMTTFLADVLG